MALFLSSSQFETFFHAVDFVAVSREATVAAGLQPTGLMGDRPSLAMLRARRTRATTSSEAPRFAMRWASDMPPPTATSDGPRQAPVSANGDSV
jgi:hypothetical protein